MPIEILMPALSPTMTEGNLAKWTKKEGDLVKPGEVIAEIETDKATMEVESVDEGRLAKILVPAGTQGVKVNELIALLLADGEKELPASPPLKGGVGGGVPAAAPGKGPASSATANTAPLSPPSKGGEAVAASSAHQAGNGARILASPLAKRLAADAGIDLSAITGTGPSGRIVKADVEKAAARKGAERPVAASGGAPAPAGIDALEYAQKLGQAFELVPHSMTRKVIARRLTESKQTVPHFYLTVDCRLDNLLALRKQLNESIDGKVSVNDFVIRATALALKQVPAANASWSEAGVLIYKNIDVSVAVATDFGLITPIIRDADTKTLPQLSAEAKTLAAKARENRLKPEEFQGGGFTISNLGMFGVKEFAAIINPPQGCILAVGAGEQRPVAVNGALEAATVMTCTLSVDHRVVDGAIGAQFLSAFKKLIEEPIRLFV